MKREASKVLYKLTDKNGQTGGQTQWGEGITHRATGDPREPLCTDSWIHVYESPLLAVLLNPIHANFDPARLWEAKGKIGKRDGQLKAGCRQLTTIREIPLPVITREQKIRFAILCALEVCQEKSFVVWAHEWLAGTDRSPKSAELLKKTLTAAERGDATPLVGAPVAALECVSWFIELDSSVRAAAIAADATGKVDLISIAEKARNGLND